jgi:hypothetical protein
MFVNEKLQQYLETSSTINTQPLVIAEWNLNIAENISVIGNYRFRPTDPAGSIYSSVSNFFDVNDCSNEVQFWCGATDADVVVDGGLDNDDQPIAFVSSNEKERILYSLEDCFSRFRPRSGINKLRYFDENYTHFVNPDLANRPRYYMASRDDKFKYWTSYRKEAGVERGIANKVSGARYFIEDAAPFVVYKEEVPANRVAVKMQTNVGNVDLGPFSSGASSFDDPFFGFENQTTPNWWKIQVLKNNDWLDAISFNPLSVRKDGSKVIGPDGHVEIAYGLIVPEKYVGNIFFQGFYRFESLLPANQPAGSAYFVKENDNDKGAVYVSDGESYDSFVPEYGWYLNDDNVSELTGFVTKFVDPEYFVDINGQNKYREFDYIRGLRVVVESMNKINSTFDLIELSPRLAVNLTERALAFSINKSASDLGVSGMPVGQLLASNGTLDIFDFDQAFSKNNNNSILSKFVSNNLKVLLFDVISFADEDGAHEYYVPLKTMFSDGFPQEDSVSRQFSLNLRDLMFYFESVNAPQLLVENASLSYAVSFLLDSIGFSNYSFKRVEGEEDPTIPYFFVRPELSIAEVLQDLAIGTQTAMFFDEYNNFIMMSKNYIMPSKEDRETDVELLGSPDQEKVGVYQNKQTKNKIANIIELASQSQEVFNDGKIIFEEKYVQKTYGSLQQASYINQDQNWIYKPALLWEVSGTPPLRSIEESSENTSSYTLSAVPLNSDLSDQIPFVENNEIQNNVIDFGEGAYWVAKYNGFFYANGEIVKYDAIEYNVSGVGNVWVSSLREYQNYFSKIQFGGKIYPTGRIRIFAEPEYEENNGIVLMKNGDVRKHGREQFGTRIAYHNAGLPEYWSDTSPSAPVGGIEMDSKYLFSPPADSSIKGVYNQQEFPLDVFIDINEITDMVSVVYAESKWVGVGTDGQFRTSTDGSTWISVVDQDFIDGYKFNSIAYGPGPEENRWIVAGYQEIDGTKTAIMAYSEDAENWTRLDPELLGGEINKVVYKNSLWFVVGNNGLIATSSDGDTWSQKTGNFDFTVTTTKAKIISATFQEKKLSVKITKGNPAVFTRKNHKLKENDRIKLDSEGTLPVEFNKTTEYFVAVRSNDTFALKLIEGGATIPAISAGSGKQSYKKLAATFKASKHGLSNNDPVRIKASGSLPSGVVENKIYYVQKIDENNIALSAYDPEVTISKISTTSNTIENGLKTFTYSGANIGWIVGDRLKAANSVNNWVEGEITAVSSTSVTINVDSVLGSGTFTSWNIFLTNGALILFVSAQTGSSHKIERFAKTNLNAVDYGSNNWIVAGDRGTVSRSTDTTSWTAIDATFGSSKIFDIHYGNGLWIVVGESGKIRRSQNSNSGTWSKVDAKIKTNIRSAIHFNDIWLVAGDNGKMSRAIITTPSYEFSSWKSVDAKFGNSDILEIRHSDNDEIFLAVGQKLKISSSSNGTAWTNDSQENVGELVFETEIPHGFTPYDIVKLKTNGVLPGEGDTKNPIESISIASPALFTTEEKHKLDNNDKIRLSVTSGGTFPTGLDNQTDYYVIKVTDKTFKVSEFPSGTPINTTGSIAGSFSFYRARIEVDTEYFVTPKNITEYKFTLASSRDEARRGITFKASGSQFGSHTVQLETDPETLIISEITNDGVDGAAKVKSQSNHELFVGDRIFFGVKKDSLYLEKSIEGGISRYAPFYVNSVISPTEFLIAEKIDGEAFKHTGTTVSLLNGESFVIIYNITKEIIDSNLLSEDSYNVSPGNLLEIISGPGELVSPTRILTTRSANLITKEITSISIAKPAVVTITEGHDLFSLDVITFSTKGILPFGIESNTPYLVQKINETQFSLLDRDTLSEVETKDGIIPETEIVEITSISIANPAVFVAPNQQFETNDTIRLITDGFLPTGFNTSTTYYVKKHPTNNTFTLSLEPGGVPISSSGTQSGNHSLQPAYRQQLKTHSFTKNINDKNRVVLSRSVNKEIPKYKVTTESIQPDPDVNITEETKFYTDISYNNELAVVQELQVENFGKSGFSEDNKELARSATRNGIIKNHFAKSSFSETDINKFLSTQTGTVQSSALIFNGPSFEFLPSRQVLISIDSPALFTTTTNHNLQNNDIIKFTTNGRLPSGIVANKTYYVIRIDDKSFNVASVFGGTALATSGTQSGNHEFALLLKRPIDFVSYIHKPLDNKYMHFGTRMRIIGRLGEEEYEQNVYNGLQYFLNPEASLDEDVSVSGGSAGLGIMINPETNIGYYFEIIALSQSNAGEFSDEAGLFNIVFYKIVRKVPNEGEPQTTDTSKAIPVKLWQGTTNIIADDGTLVGQFRTFNEANPSVYDISVEYEDVNNNTRKFYLMINNRIIAVVDDSDPLPVHNNMSLFVRGGTRAMFENVYALANNYSQNTIFELDAPVNSIFGTEKIDASQSFRKYALSGFIQSTYLSGIGVNEPPKYNIYFEEFGTIMREAAYFNVKYDKAYPALYAQISPTFNKMKGYSISGFIPSAYGAEFLVFNNTDTALNLDETSGNYLRIQGVTFTQSSQKELTVDDFFERVSNLSDPETNDDGTIISPLKAKQEFLDIKNSRTTYGRKEFNLDSVYIQSQDEARNLMQWIISKIMKPRKSVGIELFGMPTIQLGDIVSIDYKSSDGIEQISKDDNRFVVYNIEYSRSGEGPSMQVYLSEVI